MKNNSFFKPEIPPASLNLGLGSSSMNRRKSHSWIDRYPILLSVLIWAAIAAIIWWADCKINPEAHTQSLLQGLHQLFHWFHAWEHWEVQPLRCFFVCQDVILAVAWLCRARGVIGSRARFRTVWSNPWRFESSRAHYQKWVVRKNRTTENAVFRWKLIILEPNLVNPIMSSDCLENDGIFIKKSESYTICLINTKRPRFSSLWFKFFSV